MSKLILCRAFALAVTLAFVACEGRDPLVGRANDDTVETAPPLPTPEVRTLESRKLFGTLPIENRLLDPLMTFTGTGWFAYSNSNNRYPIVARQVGPSPTQTPFVKIVGADNPGGATLLGQLKTATSSLHVEAWFGRDGSEGEALEGFGTVDALLAGLFIDGGENAVPLEQDNASRTIVDGRTWVRFSADLDTGPVGWSYLMVGDTDTEATLYIGGPAAVDLDAGAAASIVSSPKRALTVNEKRLIAATQERTRTLATPASTRPAALPGVPNMR